MYILATHNKSKVLELRALLGNIPIIGLDELGIDYIPNETGKTFHENAEIKCREIAKLVNINYTAILSDDSGLAIEALNGLPGVDTANFLGNISWEERNLGIINLMKDKKNRRAKFICVIAALFPNGKIKFAAGELFCEIAYSPRGKSGFGFDPIMFLPQLNCTSAELSMNEKNRICARGLAVAALKKIL